MSLIVLFYGFNDPGYRCIIIRQLVIKEIVGYTGQAIRLDKRNLEVKVGKDVLSDDQYEIIEDTYKNNVGKGTASVQIRGVRNYGGTATVKFKIGTKGFQWINRLFG